MTFSYLNSQSQLVRPKSVWTLVSHFLVSWSWLSGLNQLVIWSVGQSVGQWVSQLVNIGQFWSVSLVIWYQLVGLGQPGGWSLGHLQSWLVRASWSANYTFSC